jgi:predicted MFS family arabinose efflux permease
MGTNAVLFPTLLPSIVNDFQLSLTAVGSVFAYNALGALLGGLLAGLGSDRMGRKPFLIFTALINSVALFLAATTTLWHIFLFGFLLIGVGQGAFGTTTNALVMDLSQQMQGRGLNRLHAAYSFGATLSPFLVTATFLRFGWHFTLVVPATFWLCLSIAILVLLPEQKGSVTAPRFSLALLAMPVILQLCFIAFFFNGTAWVLIGWIKKFVQASDSSAGWLSTSMIALFYAAFTVGRMAFSHLSERWGYAKSLRLCGLGIVLAYPCVVYSHSLFAVAFGVFFCGLSLATIYPTTLAHGSRYVGANKGALSGTAGIAMNLGQMLPPYWTGYMGDHWGLESALRVNYLLPLLLFGVTLLLSTTAPPEDSQA